MSINSNKCLLALYHQIHQKYSSWKYRLYKLHAMVQMTKVNLISKNALSILITQFVELWCIIYSSIPTPKLNEHQNVNKEYKAPQCITWHILWSQHPQMVSRNHVTVHIQSKFIIWSCGKNKRALLIPGNFRY